MQKNYNENLVAGAAIRDDKGRRISKLFEASHPKMTVGYAKNLIMPDTPTEQEFNFRQSGSGVIEDGVAVIDKVKGRSVVWNQLIKNGNFASIEGWVENGATISISNGEATISQTMPGDYGVGQKVNVVAGHKIMVLMDVKEVTSMYVGVFRSGSYDVGFQSALNTKQIDSVGFVSFFTTIGELGDYKSYAFGFARGGKNSFIKVSSVNLIDLTQMFGAGNEPTTYEEFLQRKPKVEDEFAYNEGTIVSNKVEKVKATGVNLWDEEWEKGYYEKGEKINTGDNVRSKNLIPVIGGSNLYIKIGRKVAYVTEYDKQGHYLRDLEWKNAAFSISNDASYISFYVNLEYGTTYNHDICINLSDPTINGKYFPYEKHELDLSWVKDIKDAEGVKLFEDGIKSAGTAFDEVRKNKAVKRLGVVDLGTLTWELSTSNSNVFYTKNNIGRKINTGKEWFSGNGVLSKYILVLRDTPGWQANIDTLYSTDKSYCLYNSADNTQYIHVHDSAYSDVATFKAAMSGVMLIYELAEPIEVEYDEKNLTYPVIAGGTEEAIASEPSTAFRADIGYGIDAVKTILDLRARVKALEGK